MRQLVFNITLATRALRNNRLRSGITIAVIGLGIMALVGILTGIEVMKVAISSSFTSMGVNSFQITSDVIKKKKHKGGMNISVTEGKYITYAEAKLFKSRFTFPGHVSLSMQATNVGTVRYASEKTNPNITFNGVDEEHLVANDSKLSYGRNFTNIDVNSGKYICIIGEGIAKKLFKKRMSDAIDKVILVGNVPCRVIGVLESKGSSMFMNSDNSLLLPLNTARQIYGGENSYLLTVLVNDVKKKAMATEEAEGIFRVIRRLPLGSDNNFTISQNNDLVDMVLENTMVIEIAAIAICLITLLNSVIGLMNIMLESVVERTREIGVSKALGARSSTIRSQFLTEAIIISLMGGMVGIIAGMLMGNILGVFFHIGFVVPWPWVGLGIGLCLIVGIISGIFPAIKASKLDPIVALRYE